MIQRRSRTQMTKIYGRELASLSFLYRKFYRATFHNIPNYTWSKQQPSKTKLLDQISVKLDVPKKYIDYVKFRAKVVMLAPIPMLEEAARHLFRWTKAMAYTYYYEHALTICVLNIERCNESGIMIYMLPQGAGSSKVVTYHGWGTKYD